MTTANQTTAAPTPTRPGLVPRLLRATLRCLLSSLFRFEIEGLERLPRGRYIAAANHPSWLETFSLVAFLPARGGLRVLASRARTHGVFWQRWLIERSDAVLPLDLDGGEVRGAIRGAVDTLRAGWSVLIFPEDLSQPTPPDGSVRPLRRGVAFLARASGTPVVPIGVADTRELWRGRRIKIIIGDPLEPPTSKADEEVFLGRLRETLEHLRPPKEPLPQRRPWPWLSKLF